MALVKHENTQTNKYELEVFVEAKEFDDACNRAYRKNAKRISVPGFRAGKAPRKIIEKRYGENVFFDDAIDEVYPKALDDAIQEAKLEVVAIEKLDPVEVSCEKGFTFKAVCVTKPEVEIKDYKGIEAKRPLKPVDQKAVDAQVESMRERNGRLVAVEDRAAENGDTVDIDFEGFVDGKAFEGGKAENHSLKLGSNQFIPGFEDQIVAKKTGEEFEVEVTFPEEYHEESLKGKPAVFKCKLNKIQKVELPELDDEFAKDVSEFDTLDELKADIKTNLEKQANDAADAALENELTDALINQMTAEIPEVMFESRIDNIIRDFEQRLRMQGLTIDMYMQYTGLDKDSLRAQFREQAQRQVKTRLALEAIAKLEKLEATDEDIEEEYKTLAEQYHMDVKKLKDVISKDDLKADICVDKAMKLVKDSAKVTEVTEKEEKASAKKSTTGKKTTTAKKTTAKSTTKSSSKTTEKKSTASKSETTKSTTKKASTKKPAAKKPAAKSAAKKSTAKAAAKKSEAE